MSSLPALLRVDSNESDIVSTDEESCGAFSPRHSPVSGVTAANKNKSGVVSANESVVTASESAYSLALTNDTSSSFASACVRGELKTSELRKSRAAVQRRLSEDNRGSPKHNTLDFESMPLVGRDKEVSKLKACFERMIEKPKEDSQATFESKKEFVLIEGISGAGKSAVALTLEKEVAEYTDGMFVVGKFDMNMSSEPYSGICKAFGDLCEKIKESSPEAICTVQAGLNEQLGSNVELLVQLIPELKDLVSDTFNDPAVTDIGADEIESRLDRLRFCFRALMRVFSSVFSPLVLFLDDLQWSDVSSLQVMEFLISDTQNDNALMIIGCYRSDEVDENSLLHNK